MDPNTITQLISGLGFPIVACLMMWKALQDSTKAHAEELKILRDAMSENTVVISELKTLMEQIYAAVRGDP